MTFLAFSPDYTSEQSTQNAHVMNHAVAAGLNPDDYTIVPHVGALDTFRMTNDDGSFVADITETYIDKTVNHMNEREALTGDLAPLVIGHTKSGEREVESPPFVGWARNWHKGTLGATGRPCAFFDAWVCNEHVALARNYPRRSCEVWVDRFEIDPISLLGATTPSRDLGIMKLSREGSLVVESPGAMTMPEEKKKDDAKKPDGAPAADPKETGKAKGDEGTLAEILSLLKQLVAAQGAAPAGADGAAPGGEGDQPMSDEEFEKLLASSGEGGEPGPAADTTSRKSEEPPVQNSGTGAMGYPGGDNTHVRLQRLEAENEKLRVDGARRDVKDQLKQIAATKQVNADDEELIGDLIAMPPETRARQLSRIARDSKDRADVSSYLLTSALQNAQGGAAGPGSRKRITEKNEVVRLQRMAQAEKLSFEAVARREGYDL